MTKLFYYLKRFGYNAMPDSFFKKRYAELMAFEKKLDSKSLEDRLDYYCKIQSPFSMPEQAVPIRNYKRQGRTAYFLDLKEFLHYFHSDTAFAYQFGDDTLINTYPTILKARPIDGDNKNSVLFKLNKHRHFRWVDDQTSFDNKKDCAVWRGGAYKPLRKKFVSALWQNSLCDIGQTNKPKEAVPWQKEFMSKAEQLTHKYIFCIEGNDVATNLKWVMSSNSLCLMPKPTKETWFMEGRLKAGVHYAELADDFSNFDSLIQHYNQYPNEAKKIIQNANDYTAQFRSKDLEDLLCLKVLERYANLSGQEEALRF